VACELSLSLLRTYGILAGSLDAALHGFGG
jgi:hypothetical protein